MRTNLMAIIKYFYLKFFNYNIPKIDSKKYIIFIDNKFEFHFDQITPFFESGFLSSSETLLISKFYLSSYTNTKKIANLIKLETFFFIQNRSLPNFNDKIIIYPYNGQLNFRLVLNRNALHIFITHGESNKKASINPMVRIYDYVLGYGNISTDRYIDFGIFSKSAIKNGKVIRLGDSLVKKIDAYPIDLHSPSNEDDCIVYMPTWEGGLDEENFSSAAAAETFDVLIALSEKLEVTKIVVQAHPNLGSRLSYFKSSFYTLLCRLHDAGLHVSYVATNSDKKNEALYRSLDSRKILTPNKKRLRIKYGVVDVSAAESMLAAQKIPSLILCNVDKLVYAPYSYLDFRNQSMIKLGSSSWRSIVDEYVGSSEDIENQNKFYNYLFSYSADELQSMTHQQRFEWLIKFLSSHQRPTVTINVN